MGELDLSILLHSMASLHLEYRGYSWETEGWNANDLGATGTPDTLNPTADQRTNSLSAIAEVRPVRKLSFRLGYRRVNRTLDRDGFERGNRDVNFESDGDDTIVAGVNWRQTSWFSLNADYQNGDVEQPFTQPSSFETTLARARATFKPLQGKMRVTLGYQTRENTNTATNFRPVFGCDPNDPSQPPGSCKWDRTADSSRWDITLTHNPVKKVDYLLRYADQTLTSDTAAIQGGEPGRILYEANTTHAMAQVNFRPGDRWSAFVRGWIADADGLDEIVADNFTDGEPNFTQDYTDGELGLRHTFRNSVFVGGSVRYFDYDDRNDLLDYDGTILTFNGGLAF